MATLAERNFTTWGGDRGSMYSTRTFYITCAAPFGFVDDQCEVDSETGFYELARSARAHFIAQGWKQTREYGWVCPSCAARLKQHMTA